MYCLGCNRREPHISASSSTTAASPRKAPPSPRTHPCSLLPSAQSAPSLSPPPSPPRSQPSSSALSYPVAFQPLSLYTHPSAPAPAPSAPAALPAASAPARSVSAPRLVSAAPPPASVLARTARARWRRARRSSRGSVASPSHLCSRSGAAIGGDRRPGRLSAVSGTAARRIVVGVVSLLDRDRVLVSDLARGASRDLGPSLSCDPVPSPLSGPATYPPCSRGRGFVACAAVSSRRVAPWRLTPAAKQTRGPTLQNISSGTRS